MALVRRSAISASSTPLESLPSKLRIIPDPAEKEAEKPVEALKQ